MSRSTRYLVNALLCVLVAAHAIYWFVSGQAALNTSLVVGLRVAQAVVGLAGAIWFYSRSRGLAR
jgi:hypothetical protein